MNETWLPVVGWEGFYEVSDMGRVRSVARTVQRSTAPQYVRERVLRAPLGIHGYPRVNLSRDGAPRQFLVHRLVLEAFVGPAAAGLETLHGNGVRSDCRLSNLRWGTSAENKADTVRHGHAPRQKTRALEARQRILALLQPSEAEPRRERPREQRGSARVGAIYAATADSDLDVIAEAASR